MWKNCPPTHNTKGTAVAFYGVMNEHGQLTVLDKRDTATSALNQAANRLVRKHGTYRGLFPPGITYWCVRANDKREAKAIVEWQRRTMGV